ncbi:MAG: sulfotransferase family 2 domain-containing protein [Kordiimonadaceae bacterium]|nr:sulfotransferase family 2 domain-containing protein [Kordiimonadaceae bacterium]MBO6567633.1 sulfotransferase family 2 domain-containing protein [Kordiimonadaceae bacterium]MBO6963153.1 sulfotransferase family 2 domain-containing protein [Kordiimonadaceae bacterium]
MKPILFIHIPKTAGTSLNASAEAYFGKDAIEKDYGAEAPHTTALVRQHIYGPDTVDQFGFTESFLIDRKAWLTGHFSADRYLQFLGCENVISFVREPVERVISEYLYLKRTQRMERSFEEFYRHPHETNKQYSFVGRFPWQAFHFIGTQERYADGLAHLSETLAIPIEIQTKNIRKDQSHLEIDDATRQDIAAWNERDIAFYTAVCAYMEKQFVARETGQAFCFHDVGFVPGQHAIGWAFYEGSNAAVNIDLYVDDKCVSSVLASEHVPELHWVNAPRKGCVGFRFVLDDYTAASKIEIKAQQTNQTLFSWMQD